MASETQNLYFNLSDPLMNFCWKINLLLIFIRYVYISFFTEYWEKHLQYQSRKKRNRKVAFFCQNENRKKTRDSFDGQRFKDNPNSDMLI